MKPIVDVVIPTIKNVDLLNGCIMTLSAYTFIPHKIYIINNDVQDLGVPTDPKYIEIHNVKKNLGWMGGVNYGAKQGTSKYILMLNDDTQILDYDHTWLTKMVRIMEQDETVGAVAPISNEVFGLQTMMAQGLPRRISVGFVSGFCLLVRREIFEKIGGLDEKLSGGDDVDFSIRIRDLGLKLIIARDIFVYHRGYVTGRKLFGNYWNSEEYTQKLWRDLIRKHGFRKWITAMTSGLLSVECGQNVEDFEVVDMKKLVDNSNGAKIVDVGCGGRKLFENSIGVDIVQQGKTDWSSMQGHAVSKADIECDFTKSIPLETESVDYLISKHSLEHSLDLIKTLNEWKRIIKKGGIMVFALPDDNIIDGIPLDPTHKHAFTTDSFSTLIETIGGLEIVYNKPVERAFSFVCGVKKC